MPPTSKRPATLAGVNGPNLSGKSGYLHNTDCGSPVQAASRPALGAHLSRQQRRRVKRLSDELDTLLNADRNFFERRPDRSYRIRRCFRQEIEINELMDPEGRELELGMAWFTLVRQVAPGVRMRLFVRGPRDAETDLPEAAVEELWNTCVATKPKVRELESRMERAVREHRP